jgi:hypothetical protein
MSIMMVRSSKSRYRAVNLAIVLMERQNRYTYIIILIV